MFGGGGSDFIYNQEQETSTFQSRFLAVDGSDGVTRWSKGDAFDSPTTPTGSIAGTVTSASGDALGGICVYATGWDVYVSRSSTSAADGTYSFGSLTDGTYLVRFDDCGTGTYKTQWYDGVSFFYDATLLTVAEGGSLIGIDAAMASIPIPSAYVLRREMQREYIGVAGDMVNTGPQPGGTFNDCSEDGPSIGGTCFPVEEGDLAIELSINDSSGQVVSGFYSFTDDSLPLPGRLDYGTFCGTSSRIQIPPGTELVWVFTQTLPGPFLCETTAVPTTGTIKASFFGAAG